jgi:hypothetical protein
MHEAAIFEGKNDPRYFKKDITPVDNLDLSTYSIDRLGVEPFIANNKSNKKITSIATELKKMIDANGFGYLIQNKSDLGIDTTQTNISGMTNIVVQLLVALMHAGVGQLTSKEYENLTPDNISFTKADYTVKFTPDGSDVATLGTVNGDRFKLLGQESYANYNKLIPFLNEFNILAKAQGSSTGQYSGTEDNFSGGRFDFSLTPAGAGVDDALIFFVPTVVSAGSVTRSEEDIVKEIAGIPAEKQRADVGFEQGKSILTSAGKTQVATLAQTILERFAGKTIETFELISSASPEWNNNETMASYAGKTTSGTGDPGAGSDFASNNAKLAYDRGVSFMTELNSVLKTKGHPGFDKYTVKWQITDKGGPLENGRFVDLNLVTNESKPKIEKVGTKVTGTATAGTSTGGGATFDCNVYYFKVTKPVK